LEKWERINNFDDGRADHPFDNASGLQSIMANMENTSKGKKDDGEKVDYLKAIEEAKAAKAPGSEFQYDEKDVILYSKPLSCLYGCPLKHDLTLYQTSESAPNAPISPSSSKTTKTSKSCQPSV
jgi:hypothetical protein